MIMSNYNLSDEWTRKIIYKNHVICGKCRIQICVHVLSPSGEKNLMVFQPISQSYAMGCLYLKKVSFCLFMAWGHWISKINWCFDNIFNLAKLLNCARVRTVCIFKVKMLKLWGKKSPGKNLPDWLSKSHGKLTLISQYESETIWHVWICGETAPSIISIKFQYLHIYIHVFQKLSIMQKSDQQDL